jgi:diadenosine tetraphosphatase ApaH/serine/threonine PP2A family protein phosphatase
MSGRSIVVGDIHGCYDELELLLDKVALKDDDRVISVGDLVTKGEQHRAVLDRFIDDARFSAVLGNQDRALVRYWHGEEIKLKPAQRAALDQLNSDRSRYATYLGSLPLMLDLGSHLVVHAGVRPGVALESQSVEDLTELRTLGEDRTDREGLPWYDVYDGEKTVLFGHWPASVPRRGPRAIGLDTGCVYGFQLTAFVIEENEFVSVQALKAYAPPKSPLG